MQENQFQRFENLLEEFKQYIERVQGELKKFNVASTEVDALEFEGKQYRRVYRKAQPGDVVVFPKSKWSFITANEPYLTPDGTHIIDDTDGLAYIYGYSKYYDDVDSVLVYEPIQEEKSPNQLRKEIIEKAKEFVENILGECETFRITIGKYKTVFRVNTNKRAVTALIYGAFSKEPVFKGIAKCHPDDVFNEHIGKAIALGRALNIDVSEFEQAVQPNRLVKGHKIKGDKEEGSVVDVNSVEFRLGSGGVYRYDNYDFKIIDDTNAIYE